jgi:hypothetical protein
VVFVALVVVWVASAWWWVCWERSDGGCIRVFGGTLMLTSDGPERVGLIEPGLYAHRWHESFYWLPMNVLGRAPFILIPLWAIALQCLVSAAAAWRLDTLARRRTRLNHCPTCNYDRTGLPCPECGDGVNNGPRGER